MGSLLASRSNGSLGKAENVRLADGWLCRWNCETLKRIVALHWWLIWVIETRKFGWFIMSINWNDHCREIQFLSFWSHFYSLYFPLSGSCYLYAMSCNLRKSNFSKMRPWRKEWKATKEKGFWRNVVSQKIQKSFGGTFNVPFPLYVPGLNVLAVFLVLLIQRASIVCINELYLFFHLLQVS